MGSSDWAAASVVRTKPTRRMRSVMDDECDFMFDVPFPDERGLRSTDTRQMDDRSYSSLSGTVAMGCRTLAELFTECRSRL